jgi:hypothetical protein
VACKQTDPPPATAASAATKDEEKNMKKMSVLLLGLKGVVVEDARAHLQMPDVDVYGGTGLDDLRATFARTKIDHVIMGGGLDLEVRLAIVREVFHLSDSTTVHMKDVASGPQGFFPFVRAVLQGLHG